MDKAAQIRQALVHLSVRDSLTLARAVELGRAVGKEELPTDLLLTAIRPTLQKLRAPRVPTLCRLVCGAFEDFLTDRDDDPRPPGQIARAAIRPWWRGLLRLDEGDLARLDERLSRICAKREVGALEEMMGEARTAAAGWTRNLFAELTKPRPDPTLRQLFANRRLIDDLQEMARILTLAAPLIAAWKAIDDELGADGKLAGRLILDLAPGAITVAKQHYMALSDAHGLEARYLALGILNRLVEPSQILRLGRALSWKANDTLVRDTEFGVVGERLILDLQRLARDIQASFHPRKPLPEIAPLAAALTLYMEGAESLLGEMGFRRDSPWGERILETRIGLGEALDPDCLMRIADEAISAVILPVLEPDRRSRSTTPEPDLAVTPTPATVEAAVGAARFLMLLAQRGSRHGFGQGVRPAIDAVGEAVEQRCSALLEALRRTPANPAIEAQLQAAIAVVDTLFEDGRGALLVRRIRVANQVPA